MLQSHSQLSQALTLANYFALSSVTKKKGVCHLLDLLVPQSEIFCPADVSTLELVAIPSVNHPE